jgi:hypothetical protein
MLRIKYLFSWQCEFRVWYSGLLLHVVFWLYTSVSEEHAASIFRRLEDYIVQQPRRPHSKVMVKMGKHHVMKA